VESKGPLSIVSLGNAIDGKQTQLWRQVERDIFADVPNYAPATPNINPLGEQRPA
jgi:hypothetical protein